MLCLLAVDQEINVFFTPAEPSGVISGNDDQARNHATLLPTSVEPGNREYSSYFPSRILGYLSYDDEVEPIKGE